MRKYLVAALVLTLAYTAYGIELKRVMAMKPKATVTAISPKTHIFALQSTAQGWEAMLLSDASVLQLGGVDTTAPDGTRLFNITNSTDISTAGLTADDAGLTYYNKSLKKHRVWDGDALVDLVAAASPPPEYDDALIWNAINDKVSGTTHAADIATLNTRIDNLTYRMASLEAAFVAGGGTLAPSAEVSPTSLAFGNILTQNTSNPMSVTLTSTGNADLVNGTVSITGTGAAKYSISSTTCNGATLTPGTNCLATVVFAPGTVEGTYTAQLEFPHNATGSPTTVALSGTGISTSDPAVNFFWDAENTLAANKGGITATNSGMVFNSTAYKSGAYSAEKSTNSATMTFPVTASHFDTESGSIGFWFNSTLGYVAGSSNEILRVSDGTSANYMAILQHSSGGMQVTWVASGVTSAMNYTTNGMTADTWYYVTAAWNQPNTVGADLTLTIYNENGTVFGNGAMITANNIEAWTAAPTLLRIGYSAASAYRFRLDHMVFSNDHTKDLWGIRNAGSL